MTSDKTMPELKFWWSDDEEGPYQGPFDTKEEAYDEAYCYPAACFDDPSQNDGLYILYGKTYENPEHEAEYGHDDVDNPKSLITGKPAFVTATEITDMFHKEWKTITRAPAAPLDAIEGLDDGLSTEQDAYIQCCLRGDFEEWGDEAAKKMVKSYLALREAARRYQSGQQSTGAEGSGNTTLDAIVSAIESQQNDELEEWELHLIKRRYLAEIEVRLPASPQPDKQEG